MRASILREEYECCSYCNPNGCPGHEGRIVGIEIDGHYLCDDASHTGDTPVNQESLEEAVKKAVQILEENDDDDREM